MCKKEWVSLVLLLEFFLVYHEWSKPSDLEKSYNTVIILKINT